MCSSASTRTASIACRSCCCSTESPGLLDPASRLIQNQFSSCLITEGSAVQGAVLAFLDITERGRAEELLKRAKDDLETPVRSAPANSPPRSVRCASSRLTRTRCGKKSAPASPAKSTMSSVACWLCSSSTPTGCSAAWASAATSPANARQWRGCSKARWKTSQGDEIQGHFRSMSCVAVVAELESGAEGTCKPAPACPLSVPLANWAADVGRAGGHRHARDRPGPMPADQARQVRHLGVGRRAARQIPSRKSGRSSPMLMATSCAPRSEP